MPRIRPLLLFAIVLLATLGLAFLVHTTILDSLGHSRFDDLIVASYWVNGVLATFIYGILFLFRKSLKNYIGYLFMGGSFLKFIFFFVIFYPAYRADGDMDKFEFAAFFLPYVICLVIETIFTAKMLKNLDKNSV